MNGFVAGQFRISKPESGLPGQKASVYRSYDDEQFQKTTGLARKRTTGTKMPRENSIHHGVIVCTKEYGAFVQLGKGDKYKDGFLHIGCLPNPPGVERVEVVNSVVKEGDHVWVKARDCDVPRRPNRVLRCDSLDSISTRFGLDLDSISTRFPR